MYGIYIHIYLCQRQYSEKLRQDYIFYFTFLTAAIECSLVLFYFHLPFLSVLPQLITHKFDDYIN